jgi:hypothetical protein
LKVTNPLINHFLQGHLTAHILLTSISCALLS